MNSLETKSWQWQIKNSIRTVDDLLAHVPLSSDEKNWIKDKKLLKLPFSVTPYFVSLMDKSSKCPIFAQVVSTPHEHDIDDLDLMDPLGEEPREKVPHLIHRYPDRVLFLTTDRCASYCRFCTRKRMVGQGPTPKKEEHEEAFLYIEKNKDIKEIIFSGGDPLMLSNERLFSLLDRAFSIKHLNNVRIHTRMLSFAPMRIDAEFSQALRRYNPLYIVTHFNHPKELSPLACEALRMLHDSGAVVLNQSVLLKGINDNKETLTELFRALIKNRCRPYYLHSCDLVTGAKHFRVPIKRALSLMEELRGHISGICLPTLIIDIPGGHGKVPVMPNFIVDEDDAFIYLRGFKNGVARYPKV